MRIVMLAQWYPPILGGEELHVARLAAELAARGHEVVVATLAQPGLPTTEMDGEVRVVRLSGALQRFEGLFADSARRSAAPIADPLLTLGIDRLVRSFRPDVLHAHNWLVHPALPVRAARAVPLVQTLHDFSLVCAEKVLLRKGLDVADDGVDPGVPCSGPGFRKCLDCTAHHYGPIKGPITTVSNWLDAIVQRRLVDRFIAVSEAVVVGTGIGHLPHDVIPAFVANRAPVPADPGRWRALLPAEPYVLFVGGLGRLKGVDVLLEAYRRSPHLPPLALIGYRSSETDALLADVPPNVQVLGEWPPDAVPIAWDGAIAGVVPSIAREACPTVILEASRAGRPVVASGVGGVPELIVDGITGLLVPPSDPGALADALRRVVSEGDLAASLGAAAATRSRRYTADAVVPRIEAVYAAVSGSRVTDSASAPDEDPERVAAA